MPARPDLSSTRKRPSSPTLESSNPAKKPALFSIFNGASASTSTNSDFNWLPPLGTPATCQHGVYLAPPFLPKVAAFDLDQTLIAPKSGMRFPKDHLDWKWWTAEVPGKVKKAYEDGYSIVLFSNQAQTANDAMKRAASIAEWKKKIPLIANGLHDVPFRILAANAKDAFRKPMTGMWDALEGIFVREGVKIDKDASFYVGDAAGRPKDHSSRDRKLAENVEIRFYTPEEYFKSQTVALPPLKGFHPRSLPAHMPLFTPSSTPLLPSPLMPEVVIFVGPPSAGKTTFYRRHFEPFEYKHVNQDTLRTRAKCLAKVEGLIKGGSSAVVDNTNRDRKTRAEYVTLAKKLKVPIRCLQFDVSVALAYHNNLYRAFCLPPGHPDFDARKFIGYEAYAGFANQYEEVGEREGFLEVRKVNWVFDGNEEERMRWNRWLEI